MGRNTSPMLLTLRTLLRIIQSVPRPKAEPVKRWLAEVGTQRIRARQIVDLSAFFHNASRLGQHFVTLLARECGRCRGMARIRCHTPCRTNLIRGFHLGKPVAWMTRLPSIAFLALLSPFRFVFLPVIGGRFVTRMAIFRQSFF
jgi:hypothetical protein